MHDPSPLVAAEILSLVKNLFSLGQRHWINIKTGAGRHKSQ